MRARQPFLLLVCVATLACATKENPQAVDQMCHVGTEICVETDVRVLTIVGPGPTTFTKGMVTIEVDVKTGVGSAQAVDFFANGLPLNPEPVGFPFSYPWDTSVQPEGTYAIVARTTILGRRFESDPITVFIDRTPPVVRGLTPPHGATYMGPTEAIDILFSEPIAQQSITNAAVIIAIGEAVVPTTATVTGEGKTVHVVVTDTSAFQGAGSLMGTVSRMVTDLAGNALPTPFTWTWARPIEMR